MEGKKKHSSNSPRAILVFGAPCSGKSTFAKQFANQFNATFYDLDALKREHSLSRLNEILRAAGYAPALVWLQTDVATIKSRLKVRLKSVEEAKTVYESRIKTLEAPSELENPIVLSGKHTYPTQLKQVLTQLQTR